MTRPVCEARAKAWESMTQSARLDLTGEANRGRSFAVRPAAVAMPCDRPNGCGAVAGEECREPEGSAKEGPSERHQAPPAIHRPPPVEHPCCGRCGGYLTGETDRCVCDDAKPRVDVSALLATHQTLGILLRVTDGETIEDAARRVSRRADEQWLALTRLRSVLDAPDGESVEEAADRVVATVKHRENQRDAAREEVTVIGVIAAREILDVRAELDAARTCVAALLTHIDGARCPWHPEHVDTCADCALFKAAREMGGST